MQSLKPDPIHKPYFVQSDNNSKVRQLKINSYIARQRQIKSCCVDNDLKIYQYRHQSHNHSPKISSRLTPRPSCVAPSKLHLRRFICSSSPIQSSLHRSQPSTSCFLSSEPQRTQIMKIDRQSGIMCTTPPRNMSLHLPCLDIATHLSVSTRLITTIVGRRNRSEEQRLNSSHWE